MTHLLLPTENLENLLDETLVKEIITKQTPEDAVKTINVTLKLLLHVGQQNVIDFYGEIPETSPDEMEKLVKLAKKMQVNLSDLRSEVVRQGLAKLIAEHSLSKDDSFDSSSNKK